MTEPLDKCGLRMEQKEFDGGVTAAGAS